MRHVTAQAPSWRPGGRFVSTAIVDGGRFDSAAVAERLCLRIRPGLIRLSVGIETVDDLVADLRQTLDRIVEGRGFAHEVACLMPDVLPEGLAARSTRAVPRRV